MANDPKLQIQIDAFTEGFKKGLAEAGSSLDSFKNKSEDAGEKSSASMFKAVLGANLLVEGTKKLLGAGIDMGKSFIQNAMQIEQVKISFDVLLGSAQKAGQMMKDLANFALATPFELPQLQEGAKKLLAYGISATGILPIMKSLGEVTAAVGTEKLPFLTLALGQVYTAGRLMGTELRQFSENGVPLLGELAKHFNTTTQAVQTMVTEGKIGFKDVAETLFAMTGQGGRFANMMIGQAKTVGGMWSNITDAIGQTGNALLGLNDKGVILEGGFFSIMRSGLEQVMNLLMNFKMLVSGQIDFSSFLQLAGFTEPVIQAIIGLGNAFQWVGGMIGQFFQSTIGQGLAFGSFMTYVVGGLVIPALMWLGTALFGTFAMVDGVLTLTKAGFLQFLIGPVGLMILGVALLFTAWQTNFLGIRDVTQSILGETGQKFGQFGQFLLDNLGGITSGIFEFTNGSIEAFNSLIQFVAYNLAPMFASIVGFGGWAFKELSVFTGEWVGNMIETIGQFLQWIMPAVIPILKSLVTTFGEIFKNIMLVIVGATKFIGGIFSGDWKKMLEGWIDMNSGIVGAIASVFDGVATAITKSLAVILNKVADVFDNPVFKNALNVLVPGAALLNSDSIKSLATKMDVDVTAGKDAVNGVASGAKSLFLGGIKEDDSSKNLESNNKKIDDIIGGILGNIDNFGKDFAKIDFKSLSETVKSGYKSLGTTVDEVSQETKKMLLEFSKNPPELQKLGEDQKQAIQNLLKSIGQGAIDFGKSISETKTSAIKLPEFKLDIKMSDKAMVDMNAQIQKQQEEFLASIKNTAKPADGSGSGSGKSPADKEADAKQKAMALQKQQIDAEIKQKKDKFDGEINTLESQKKELENKQKLLQITQEDLKLNTSKSDVLEKQVQALQDQIEAKRQEIADAKAAAQDEIQNLQIKKTNLEREESQKKLDLQDLVKDTTKSDALKEEIQLLERKATLTQDEKDQLKQLKFDLQDQVQIENDLYDAQKAKANTEIKALNQQQLDLQTKIDSKQQSYQNMDGSTKDLEAALKAKKTELSNTKDQEKADYEAVQALRDKQKKDYDLAKFNLETAIDQKKTDEANALKPLQAKKQLLDGQLLSSNVDQFNAGNSAYAIPSFASGVENFGGGLAKVHKGEVLMNLSKGTSVINQDRGQKTGIGGNSYSVIFEGLVVREQADLDWILNEIGRRFNSAV